MLKLFVVILSILFSVKGENPSLENYLHKKLEQYNRFEYKIISVPKGLSVYDENKLEIFYDGNFKLNGSYAYVPVKLKFDKSASSSSYITLRVNLFADVLVASRDIKKGELLYSNDFVKAEVDVTSLRTEPFIYDEVINEYKARTAISSGTVLEDYMVEKAPLINTGDVVNAILNNGSVTVTFSASARTCGGKGDIIRVSDDSKRIFKVEIIDSKNVKIVE
ncbi:MAG: flagellar basal body P-ring formation chaperone FlgA [bacterium]